MEVIKFFKWVEFFGENSSEFSSKNLAGVVVWGWMEVDGVMFRCGSVGVDEGVCAGGGRWEGWWL